jgi:hypothetical protein
VEAPVSATGSSAHDLAFGRTTVRDGIGARPLADVVGSGTLVPLDGGGVARYVNLDYAATAPSLTRVAARVAEVLP